MLNGRVRNGNGCDHPGMLTGKLLVAVPMDRHGIATGNDKSCLCRALKWECEGILAIATEQRINAAKQLAVSTG
jgi:hypothetical protein